MNKNNLMNLIVLLFIFSLLIAMPRVNSVLEQGAGFGGSSDEISPADITKPVEFPEGYLDLIDKKEKTYEDFEAIEEIEKNNNLGFVEVGDVKIPLNTETHDGNVGGATASTFELKGGLGGDLISFKTLTSKSGNVLDVSRAGDIEKVIIKDGEIAEIIFSKIDESNENLNEVLYSSGEGKGLWFSPSTPEEGESEETNIQINEFGEGTIGIKATAGVNIDISGKENSEIKADTDVEINVDPLGDGSSYIEGTHITAIKGTLSVNGEVEDLKVTLLPSTENEAKLVIFEKYDDKIVTQTIEILHEEDEPQSPGESEHKKNIYMNCDEDKIGDDEDKIIYSFGDIKEGAKEAQTQIDATQASGVEITTAIEGGNEVTAKCEEDKTVKVSTWDIIKNAANKAISDIKSFFQPGEPDVEEEKTQTTISFPFTQPTSSEGGGGGGVGVIDSAEKEEKTSEEAPEEIIKIDVEASGSIKAGIGAISEKTIQINDKVTIEEGGDKLDSTLSETLESIEDLTQSSLELTENTEKAKAVLEAAYNRAEEGENAQHCWDACAKTYEEAGAGWQTVFVNLPEGDDRIVSVNSPPDEQRDNLVPGDIVEYHIPGKDYGHNVIFIEWEKKENCIAKVAQQSTSTSPITLRDQSLCGDYAPIIIWQPV
ncbi:hypothetical protein COY26_01670 [Candidatus Woesearchaeota archaeon CG_4_10_14_0_2_um_filter_33_10]|nr:MAG: hypothetical protein COV14_05075 [Candidatus Woesearchaeota archaeon CG10_big_fil_rev_8_21_14_0_10_33_12]PIU72828.1 MAG: hypothetical protein COS79_00895 [Candidatus Woesearchaeota archaeon CG06_land_8_20_14_3_00_33_13]PIZ53513.1 MAG: hypothetical protein COY26_01670 [Candidatus Woesearchaeota archaeon CG_4_10_14_0_2_um_filter_33_10]